MVNAATHCCAIGASAARVDGGGEHASLAACEAACVTNPSCRFLSYDTTLSRCDFCSACDNSTDATYDSYRRVEPVLPSLLPFSLSLNGQQYELDDADWTAELGYVMYAAAIYNISMVAGPTVGGTLVTVTGRGFARAASRPASAR